MWDGKIFPGISEIESSEPTKAAEQNRDKAKYKFDTSRMCDMSHMFDNCPIQISLDLSSWDWDTKKFEMPIAHDKKDCRKQFLVRIFLPLSLPMSISLIISLSEETKERRWE